MIFVSSTIFFILLTAFFLFKKKAKDRKDLLLITVIFFISLIFFFPLFLGNYFSPSDMLFSYAPWKGAFGYKSASNPLLGDLTFQVYPWNHFLKYSIEKHIIPLWNPFTSCGAPFFANGSSSVFFPLKVLLLFFSPQVFVGIEAFLKLFFAGFFMFIFMRNIQTGRFGAFIASILFMLSGPMMVWIGWPMTNLIILVPLFFLLGEKVFTKPTFLNFFLLSILIAFAFFGGHPETLFHIGFLLSIYILFLIIYTHVRQLQINWVKGLIVFIGAWIAGFLLAGVQLFPFIEFMLKSSRFSHFTTIKSNPFIFPFSKIIPLSIRLFLPNFFGNPIEHNWWGFGNYNEAFGYVGVVGLILGLAGGLYGIKKDLKATFFFLMAILCFAITFQIPKLFDFIVSLPGFKLASNHRIIFGFSFFMASLAGIYIEKGIKQSKIILLSLFSMIFVFTIFILYLNKIKALHLMRYELNQLLLFLIIIFVFIFWTYLSLKRNNLSKILISLLILFDLFWFFHNYTPFINRKDFYPKTEAIKFLQKKAKITRIVHVDCLPSNTPMVYNIYEITGNDPMKLRSFSKIISLIGKYDPIWPDVITKLDSAWIDFLNARFIVTPPGDKRLDKFEKYKIIYDKKDLKIYENKKVMPRFSLAFDPIIVNNRKKAFKILKKGEVNPRRVVIVKNSDILNQEKREGEGNIKIKEYSINRIELEVNLNKDGYLVTSEIYYPGWHLFIDGKKENILIANYAFRSAFLKAGIHNVVFVYRPYSFLIGMIVSLFTFVSLLSLFLIIYLKNKKGK